MLGFQITASRISEADRDLFPFSTQVPTLLVALFSVAVLWLVQRFL